VSSGSSSSASASSPSSASTDGADVAEASSDGEVTGDDVPGLSTSYVVVVVFAVFFLGDSSIAFLIGGGAGVGGTY